MGILCSRFYFFLNGSKSKSVSYYVCSGLCWFQDEISYHYLNFFLPVSLNLGKSAAKGVTFMFCRIWKWKQYMKNTTDGVNGFILSFNFVCPTKCVPSFFQGALAASMILRLCRRVQNSCRSRRELLSC